MSLDKAVKHKKEKRKPYYKSKRFDKTCRNHGSCGYCKDNRTKKINEKAKELDKELEDCVNKIIEDIIDDIVDDRNETD